MLQLGNTQVVQKCTMWPLGDATPGLELVLNLHLRRPDLFAFADLVLGEQ